MTMNLIKTNVPPYAVFQMSATDYENALATVRQESAAAYNELSDKYQDAIRTNNEQGMKLREAAGALARIEELQNTLAGVRSELATAKARLAELEKQSPSVIVTPEPPKPAPEEPASIELQAYIVDNGSYGDELIDRMTGYVQTLKPSEFKYLVVFQNKLQMVKDKFPQVIIDAGKIPVFDTMWAIRRTCTNAEFEQYMIQAEKFNPHSYRFDDVHNQSVEEVAAAVRFMRGFTNKPIYATLGADDMKTVTNPITKAETRVPVDVAAYVQAGLKITRQFFRQENAGKENPTAAVDTWLKARLPKAQGGQGRIIDGVDLEAFRSGGVTTSPEDFEDMLRKCVAADIDLLTVYAVVNNQKWQMWEHAPELWARVNEMAYWLREARRVKA